MTADANESYISGLEKGIKEKEREIKKLEPQVAPLQAEVSRCSDAMETAKEFYESCEADFDDAYYARKRVTDRIDDRRKFLARDNDLLNAALRHKREREKRERRRAELAAKRKEKEK